MSERGITREDIALDDDEPQSDVIHDRLASEQGYGDEDYIDEQVTDDREGLDG